MGLRNWRRTAVGSAVLILLVGCSGDPEVHLSDDSIPTSRHGTATAVDVCQLVSISDVAGLLGHSVEQVGFEYLPAGVATARCDYGEDFGVSEVSVQLAAGPVSLSVFRTAYGYEAGGAPQFLAKLGDGGYLRTDTDQRSLHILVNGSILTLEAVIDPVHPIGRPAFVQVARLALDRLPRNPELAPTDPGERCAQIQLNDVAAAIGATPTLVSHFQGPQDSLECSWGSKPGAAVVTVVTDPARIADYRRNRDPELYVRVHIAADVTSYSRVDRAGDLLMFVRSTAVVLISVLPTAGYADPKLPTSPGEFQLASSVLATLV